MLCRRQSINPNIEFDFRKVGNIVEKGENTGYQHLLFFHTMFSKCFLFRSVKSLHSVEKGAEKFSIRAQTVNSID